MPCTAGLPRSVASASARNAAASGTSCCGSSWSSSASTRCSGESSGVPMRRASSCAAPTASWLFNVSVLKSMSVLGDDVDRRPPHDEVAPVLAVHLADRLAHLALHAIQTLAHAHQLVLQAQHLLHAGEVQSELRREPLNQAEPVEVGFGVQPRVTAGPLGTDQALALVDAKRLR